MIDLGRELRDAREAKGISLTEAAEATRIKERYLKALETNDWASLPTQVQTRGFLRNYGIYLGLDEDQVMASFSQATRSAAVSLPPPSTVGSPVPTTNDEGTVFRPRDIDIERMDWLPAWLSSDILIGIALALVVAGLGFGLLQLIGDNSSGTPAALTDTPAVTPMVTPGTVQPTLGGAADQGTPAVATATFDAGLGGVQLSLEATEHVWVRVTVDGVQVLEGILVPGAPQMWQGAQQITLETANGAGLEAVVNGQPQGQLGERGQSIILTWGPNGLLSVTPTAAP
jgi:cytoskeleton protein RodZ